jgi:hypothetical protein
MKYKYIIWSSIAALALTLASCTPGPGAYISKRIERAKLLNEINDTVDGAKIKNDAIGQEATKALQSSVSEAMQKHCSRQEISTLVRSENCYVDKLKVIRDNKDPHAVAAAKTACYAKDIKKGDYETQISDTCKGAIMTLVKALKS